MSIVYKSERLGDEIAWVAISLEKWFAAQGRTPEEARTSLRRTIAAHIAIERLNTVQNTLATTKPAPAEYWEMFDKSSERICRAEE